MTKKKIKNKRLPRFQLLEVMVAIFLIVVCAAPALKIHIALYLEQNHILRENKRDHLVHLVHAAVVEKLYKNEIPIQNILTSQIMAFEDNATDSMNSIKQQLDKLYYHCQYSFKLDSDKPKKKLVKLIIEMKDLKKKKNAVFNYNYLVFISLTGQPDLENQAAEVE